jgi:hypothetical protein
MEFDAPRLVLAGYAAVLAVALLVAATTSGVAFGAYNPAWDGASDLQGEARAVGAEPTVLDDLGGYREADPSGTVAVVLSPDEPYTDGEAATVRSFVRDGGTLVVAEDFGPHGNGLLADVGADARVDGRPLRDERRNYRSPALPVATNVSGANPDGTANYSLAGVEQVTLNHGTAVDPNGAAVLARTSPYAYVDANRNEQLDDEEELASRPVATVEAVGEGHVVVVGDPSALINAMLDRPGNRAFVRALFAGHDRALLDYSHTEGVPPLSAALLAVRGSPPLQLLGGLGAILGAALWVRQPAPLVRALGRLRRQRPAPPVGGDPEALTAYLLARHPDWSRERVRRVVDALVAGDDDREA